MLIKDFRVLYVPLGIGGAVHPLYIKQHSDNSGANDSKTLFVGNIDYGRNLSHQEIDEFFKDIFSGFGAISSCSVSEYKNSSPTNGGLKNSRFAHLTFQKKSSLKSIVQSTDTVFTSIFKDVSTKWGVSDMINAKKTAKEILQQHSIFDTNMEELKENADSFMTEFDEKEQIQLSEKRKRSKEADEDGFVLVKNRKKLKRVSTKRGSGPMRERKKKKQYDLKNFYRFQIKEQKMEELTVLRRKFEDDKARVAKMKLSRAFKPF